jgi:hypothetical protein
MTGRVIPAAVNWAQLLKQTAPADKKLMAAFKVKSDVIAGNYAKASAVNRNINWDYFENAINNKSLVAEFKAKFEATEIPVPSDEGRAAALEARAAQDEVAVADYIAKVDGQIDDASVTLNNIKALPPFEQMTQQDIMYWFPQLCRNQAWAAGEENTPPAYIHGVTYGDTGFYEYPGTLHGHKLRQDEIVGDESNGGDLYRLDEGQFPGGQYPDFFSRFPSEDFKESFALSDPLIQWENIAHHPQFDAEVKAIQEAEGVLA